MLTLIKKSSVFLHVEKKGIRTVLQKFFKQLPYLPQAWQLIWSASRSWTIGWIVLLILQGLLPVAIVYLSRDLVDQLSLTLKAGNAFPGISRTLWLVALLAFVSLLGEALNALGKWVRTAQAELVADHISNLIHAKSTALNMAFYDSPEFYDRLYRARIESIERPVALLENIGNLLQSGLTLIAMAGVLLAFGWWMPLLLLVGVVPALVVVIRSALQEHYWRHRNTTAQRSVNYYDWVLTDRDFASEIRLFNLGENFRQAYQNLRRRLRTEHTVLMRNHALAEFFAGILALLAMGLIMSWMVWRAINGALSLGNLALFYQAFSQGQKLLQTLLGNAAQIYTNILFLENLFEFLSQEPQLSIPAIPAQPPEKLIEGISFEQVYFHYPGSRQTALDKFDLKIPAGKIIAIVGENGAGKSTLIKLLCRFYDPDEGKVTLDGIDIREFSPEELRHKITVLFQQPAHYYATIGENIRLGDWRATHDSRQLESAAQAAGATDLIERLPQKYDTILVKEFGGTELSGGEWQRVALARAFLRQAPLIILDEPTSAMDSWAEADWMARFRALVADRTALIITHRFTTAMQADVIHVMAQGKVIESGTHDELLQQNGRYAQSWRQQIREQHSTGEEKEMERGIER